MNSPKVTLGSARLDASSAIGWALTVGVQPFSVRIELDKDEAENIPPIETTLTMEAGGQKIEAKGVHVIGEVASQDPNRRAFMLADKRYLWNREHVFRRYNIRTRSGTRRRVDVDGAGIEELGTVVADVTYKRFSLRDGEPWTAADVAEDVLNEVIGEGEWSGNLLGFSQAPIDNIVIDDDGPQAIQRALGYLIGAAPFVDLEGRVHIINVLDDESTARMLKNMSDEVQGSPHAAFVDLSDERPRAIRVLMTPEAEVRFDYYGPRDTITGDERWFENVTPVPDLTLDVGGNTLVSGTFGETSKILEAWSDDLEITDQDVRERWLFAQLEASYSQFDNVEPRAMWSRRIGALRGSYRQLFRISPRWIGAIHSFRPYRVSLIDPETGTFAESRVYADYAVIFSQRGQADESGKQAMNLGANVEGGVEPNAPLVNSGESMARLSVVDPEEGIVQFDFTGNIYGHYAQIIPSKVNFLPTFNASDWNEGTYFSDGTKMAENEETIALEEEYRASFIVTCVPGSPNATGQLYSQQFSPSDIDDYLPIGVSLTGVKSNGPVWTARVGPGITTARFGWSQDRAEEIARAFGVSGEADENAWEGLSDLIDNPEEVEGVGKAVAASIFATFSDRWQGAKVTSGFDDAIEPRGTIVQVAWSLSQMGQPTTSVSMPEPRYVADPVSLLPGSLRALVLREVQP